MEFLKVSTSTSVEYLRNPPLQAERQGWAGWIPIYIGMDGARFFAALRMTIERSYISTAVESISKVHVEFLKVRTSTSVEYLRNPPLPIER